MGWLKENLQETIDFPMKYGNFLYFSLQPINWISNKHQFCNVLGDMKNKIWITWPWGLKVMGFSRNGIQREFLTKRKHGVLTPTYWQSNRRDSVSNNLTCAVPEISDKSSRMVYWSRVDMDFILSIEQDFFQSCCFNQFSLVLIHCMSRLGW